MVATVPLTTSPRSRKRATHAEDAFQASLVSYLRTVLDTKLYVVLAVPNGGLRAASWRRRA